MRSQDGAMRVSRVEDGRKMICVIRHSDRWNWNNRGVREALKVTYETSILQTSDHLIWQ